MTRTRLVVAHSNNGWTVMMSGSRLSSHPTQAEAIDAARSVAQFLPSELTVQGRDGRFRTGYTYGGVDPFPPRG